MSKTLLSTLLMTLFLGASNLAPERPHAPPDLKPVAVLAVADYE